MSSSQGSQATWKPTTGVVRTGKKSRMEPETYGDRDRDSNVLVEQRGEGGRRSQGVACKSKEAASTTGTRLLHLAVPSGAD